MSFYFKKQSHDFCEKDPVILKQEYLIKERKETVSQ